MLTGQAKYWQFVAQFFFKSSKMDLFAALQVNIYISGET
jgi:hypothetical protein